MQLKSVHINNFKNISNAELSLSDNLNCFTGNNGTGKTNFLDALYYLSFTKSYLNTGDAHIINNKGADFFTIKGVYERNGKTENIYCAYEKNRKKVFKRNDKAYKKFSEHIGLLPVVMISPYDGILITGSGEERRKYIDAVISQYDKEYLHELIKYNRYLSQRNHLLKNYQKTAYFDKDTIHIYNEQLTETGRSIYRKRQSFINELKPIFSNYYKIVSKDKEQVDLRFKSHLNHADFSDLLEESIETDKIRGYTAKGIHRDDIALFVNNLELKKAGSQGQQKTFLLALKFAQFQYLKEQANMAPMLLLDDIFDKFDSERVTEIIKLTNSNFGQIFITDTNPERVKKILQAEKGNYKLFHTENGSFTEN